MWSIAEGTVLLIAGVLLLIYQVRNWAKGKQDTVGWGIRFFIIAIACIVSGIILIVKHL